MNKRWVAACLSVGLLSPPSIWAAEQQATARLWCESLHFSQGKYGDEALDLSTINGVANGELAPYDGDSLTSGFIMTFVGVEISGTIFVGLPPLADEDHDGFDDFYESSRPVYATTIGSYQTPISQGTVRATWNRVADSKDGSCVLDLVDSIYGALGGFSHSFELLEYTGPILYTPGQTTVSNRFELKKTGSPEQQIGASFVLTKKPTDRYNILQLPPGNWTNTPLGTVSVLETVIMRESPWPTNYYGFLEFQDGDPGTAGADFLYWTISIDDLNDANKNGIPDFSDDPLVVRSPRLAITLEGSTLNLHIEGEKGRTYLMQETSSLPLGPWKDVSSVTLTNDSQSISVSIPQQGFGFWRALAQ